MADEPCPDVLLKAASIRSDSQMGLSAHSLQGRLGIATMVLRCTHTKRIHAHEIGLLQRRGVFDLIGDAVALTAMIYGGLQESARRREPKYVRNVTRNHV